MAGPALRILGIDPGLRITGFGIIEKNGSKLAYVVSGCIRSGEAELPDRLKDILEGLREIIEEHRPQQTRSRSSRPWSATATQRRCRCRKW